MPWELNGNSGITTTNFLGTRDQRPLVIRTNNTERVRVTPAGNVGIGTSSPRAKLHIVSGETTNHASRISSNPSSSEWPNQLALHGSALHSEARLGFATTGNDGGDHHTAIIKTIVPPDGGGDLVFQTREAGFGPITERLRITSDGHVTMSSLHMQPQDGTNEGGEITLLGAGANTPVYVDNFAGSFRVITQDAERLRVSPGGDVTVSGDILLPGADCAEEFDVSNAEEIEPGTVMVIDEEGALRESSRAYDKTVAGVVSGGGNYRAGLILDKQGAQSNRKPVALVGKVACKVDAGYSPVEVGDLLTTAPTPGHAMKANDPLKATGAVIGKALQRLTEGRGLIGVLVALQ